MTIKFLIAGILAIGSQMSAIEKIVVKKGNPILLSFPDNRVSNGYSWHLVPSENSILQLSEEKYVAGTPGTAGSKEFTFQTPATGKEILFFEKKHPHETVPPVSTREYEVTVLE